MWLHVGTHHLDEAEWFIKIDDDSFLSAVNMRGYAKYFNPDGKWYFGHTLMHLWSSKNLVFNSGTCYAISRGSLRSVLPIFRSHEFQHDTKRRHSRPNYCTHRGGDQEDPTMSVCLKSVGVQPTNTLDEQFRERFLPFRVCLVFVCWFSVVDRATHGNRFALKI